MDFSKIKKEIGLFLTSEEAKVLKKDIVKLGLTASVITAVMAQVDPVEATTHGNEHSDIHSDGHDDHASHTDDPTHDDAHSDSHTDSHSDSHYSHNENLHTSAAKYDPGRKAGGHGSNITGHNSHDESS